MKTFKRLCKRFEKLHPDYSIWFNELESYQGFYRIAITRTDPHLTSYYNFYNCKDFENWMDNIILD